MAAEFGRPFGADFEATGLVTRLVKQAAGDIPVAVKLTVNCPSIGRMARVCQDEGADAVTAINTIGPGMVIDTGTGRPVLSNRVGGVSGPAILPIAVRAVYEIYGQIGLKEETTDKIYSQNLLRFLGVSSQVVKHRSLRPAE